MILSRSQQSHTHSWSMMKQIWLISEVGWGQVTSGLLFTSILLACPDLCHWGQSSQRSITNISRGYPQLGVPPWHRQNQWCCLTSKSSMETKFGRHFCVHPNLSDKIWGGSEPHYATNLLGELQRLLTWGSFMHEWWWWWCNKSNLCGRNICCSWDWCCCMIRTLSRKVAAMSLWWSSKPHMQRMEITRKLTQLPWNNRAGSW